MATREEQSAPDGDTLGAGPSVFISYRRRDTGGIAGLLSERLSTDLGARNVFRDKDNLIAGQRWQDVLDSTVAKSDATVCVVGPNWAGDREDGTRRIDDPSDAVRQEVRQALDEGNQTRPVPMFVDITEPPSTLPEDVSPLFDHHAVRTTRDELDAPGSTGYQSLLVGIWETLRQRVPNGILVVGEQDAMASLDRLVDELRTGDQIAARDLSRFASGAYVLSARHARHGARRWPDVIVIANSEPSQTLRARLQALDEHPTIRNVSLVAVGAGAALAASGVVAGTGSLFGSPASLVSSLPSSGGPLSGLAGAWSAATVGAKTAMGIGAVIVAGVAAVATVALVPGDSASACSGAAAGSVVEGTLRADGETECFVFRGDADDDVLLRIDDGDGDGLFVANMQVVRPDGSQLDDCADSGTYEAEVICPLDMSGDHVVEVTQIGKSYKGDFAFTWRSLTSSDDCTIVDSSTVTTGIIEHESKPACFVASLTAGQSIFMRATQADDTFFAGSVRVVRPDGTVRTDCTDGATYDVAAFCDIDMTGEHLFLLTQFVNDDGPMMLWWQHLDDLSECVSAPVSDQATVVIPSKAQPSCFRATGEQDDNAVMEISSDRGAFGNLWLIRPDGSRTGCDGVWKDEWRLECVLDVTGEHIILLTSELGGLPESVTLTWSR